MLQWPAAAADSTLVPPEVQEAFERVRSGADFMPAQQMEVRSDASLLVLCPTSCGGGLGIHSVVTRWIAVCSVQSGIDNMKLPHLL